jgi:RHS repeat-associated protein
MFAAETAEQVYNSFKFTGQWWDSEIGQYYLRARQYDPALMRFTARDPVKGNFRKPLSLHPYLYCQNDSINATDINGRYYDRITGALMGGAAMHAAAITALTAWVAGGGVMGGADNDILFEVGIGLEASIPIGAAAGAVIGPNLASIQIFVGIHAYSIVDVIGVVADDPHLPVTPAGWAVFLFKEAYENSDY